MSHIYVPFDVGHNYSNHLPNYYFQEPQTVVLGTESAPTQVGNKRRLSDCKATFQYVPLLDGLRSLLMNQEILDEVCKHTIL